MSSHEELGRKRSSKPLMEKRRRARINDSLLQLKNLVLDALNKNNPRHSKLEKADILEMTVRYLRSIHRQQLSGMVQHDESANSAQYQSGYAQCMHEVSRYLNATSNPNNVSNHAIVLRNLTPKEATERQIQASLLNHLVTQSIDNNTPSVEETPREFKNIPTATLNRSSNNVPTLQLYIASNKPNLLTSSLDAAPSSVMEETVSGVPTTPSSSVFSGVGSVATADPMACPSINHAGAMTGEEITLVLPQNLMYSGQIATHVIPIYAANPPVISQAPPKTALSSSSLPVMRNSTSVAGSHGNGKASNSFGNAEASVDGRFTYIPTPTTSSTFSAPNPMNDTYRPSSTDTIPEDFKSRSITPPMTPTFNPTSLSLAISSAPAIHCNMITTAPLCPTTKTTAIKEPSQPYGVHTTYMTENPSDVTKTTQTFRSVVPTQSTISSIIPTSASKFTTATSIHHKSKRTTVASSTYQGPIPNDASVTSFVTPGSSVSKRQPPTLVSPVTEPFSRNPPEHHPRMISNRTIIKISVDEPDIRSKPTRSQSPHRTPRPPKSKRIRAATSVIPGPTQPHRNKSIPAPSVVLGPPEPSGSWSIPGRLLVPGPRHPQHIHDVDPNRNEIRDVNGLGVGRKVAWRPW